MHVAYHGHWTDATPCKCVSPSPLFELMEYIGQVDSTSMHNSFHEEKKEKKNVSLRLKLTGLGVYEKKQAIRSCVCTCKAVESV